jgi:hypothetical protein
MAELVPEINFHKDPEGGDAITLEIIKRSRSSRRFADYDQMLRDTDRRELFHTTLGFVGIGLALGGIINLGGDGIKIMSGIDQLPNQPQLNFILNSLKLGIDTLYIAGSGWVARKGIRGSYLYQTVKETWIKQNQPPSLEEKLAVLETTESIKE